MKNNNGSIGGDMGWNKNDVVKSEANIIVDVD